MANSMLRSVDGHSKRIFLAIGLLSLVSVMQNAGASEFKVGGVNGWTVTSNPDEHNQWAQTRRFQKGDTLLFVYKQSQDSVLQVSKEDYDNCNTGSPIAKFEDGNTSFNLSQSGPYYFISGKELNCRNNEKLTAIVLSDRSITPPPSPPTPPPSSPPPPPPSSPAATIPAPAPAGEEFTSDKTPPPPPPPPNGASSSFVSLASSIGAFVMGSSILLVL
ncbi:hypothetical protein MKW94_029005 [Papaver nudicaule]|uniref:Phytocyanin domain-containing protein n=1 Tax=Papaver nudicaule TaxID=74823 RepID=A0AA42B1H1_PAPNU|nr:hypothetical protein [Papaver nudicaule]